MNIYLLVNIFEQLTMVLLTLVVDTYTTTLYNIPLFFLFTNELEDIAKNSDNFLILPG